MNKKTIKIGFKHFWERFDPEEFILTKLLKKKYNVVLSYNPDYMFFSVFNFSEKEKKINFFLKKILTNKFYSKLKNAYLRAKRNKTPLIGGDFVKIFFGSGETSALDMNKCDYAFSYHYEDRMKNKRYMRMPLYAFWKEKNKEKLIKKRMDFQQTKKEKTKFCNFIYSNNVSFRNEFFKKLTKYKRVDSYGKCMNNSSFPESKKDKYEQKLDLLKNYKFTIAFENSSVEGYTTEKLIHPMLVGSIPIYWGNPRIGEDFNTKSFINVHDYNSIDEVIERIKEIDKNEELYEKMLKEPWFKNNKPNKWFDEKRVLDRLVEIIEKGKTMRGKR